MAEEICCPEFDPAPWDNETHEWKGKKFIRTKVATFLHVPLNFASVMRKAMKQVDAAGASVPDYLALSDHVSRWRMDVYLAVDKEVPGAENTTLSGKFFSRVYEGPFKDSRLWCNDFQAVSTEKKLNIKKWYMWYTTCPKCAKKYGKNYVVLVGQVE